MSESAVEATDCLAEPLVAHVAEPSDPVADLPLPAWGERLPGPAAFLLAALAGIALWLSFPDIGWWPLAPVGVAGSAWAARGQSLRRGAALGVVTGLSFFAPHLHWSGVYVGNLPWIALSALEAGYLALLGAALPLVWRARGGAVTTVLGVAGLWVGQEALRGRTPFGGFPWGRLAFSQSDGPMLGYASLGGAPGVSAMVAASGACLAVAVVHGHRALFAHRRAAVGGAARRRALLPAATALAVALGAVAAGALVPRPVARDGSARVAAVQGNVPKAGLDFNAQRRAVLDNHVTATRELAARVRAGEVLAPQVVLWPENASDIDPLRNPDARTEIQATVDDLGVPVLLGTLLEEPVDHLSNASLVWLPTSSGTPGPAGRYVKRHPAPFGEYIPYRSFFRHLSDKVDLVRLDFWPGSSVGVLDAAGLRLGSVICFEVAYDGLVRDTVRAGAQLLVVQTNNATFGYTDESVQQLAMSRLRAVETGRSVVHISTVGVSALILPDGSVAERSGLFTRDVLQAALPLSTRSTLATRLGDGPEIALSALGLIVAALGAASLIRGRVRDRVRGRVRGRVGRPPGGR